MGLSERVASRYKRELLAKAEVRQDATDDTHPVNKPKGIAPNVVREHGKSVTKGEGIVKPSKKDIVPSDVFPATPNHTGMRSLAETGRDLSKALDKQVPKDKGYDAVKNLSQYMIETQGGGGSSPVPKK